MKVPADNSPLLCCLNELDFSAIDFLSRQFLKGIFQVAVRGKLNNPAKTKQLIVNENIHKAHSSVQANTDKSLTLHWAWGDVRQRMSPLQLVS